MIQRYIMIAIASYLIGSISISVILSATLFHKDVRKHGSGNAGATNVARVFGMTAGVMTLIGDMLKTALAGMLGLLLGSRFGLVIGCIGCLVGHSWPIFFRFRGGKGVAVSACIALLLDWRLFAILVASFLLMFLLTRRVSVGSITAAILFPVVYWLLHPGICTEFFLALFICVLVLFQHRDNIGRLIRGKEAEFRPKEMSKNPASPEEKSE